jgi:hypothetical protein
MAAADIPGWFPWVDRQLFTCFLRDAAPDERLDVLELGTYLGRSAVHIGAYLRSDETFFACDLFDPQFKGLTREKFEQNYLAVRGDLPVIVEGQSTQVLEFVRPHSLRFVHVDASHDYDDVRADLGIAEQLLAEGGVVAFDDFRTHHAPGVAAAVWGAVEQGNLTPLCLSEQKFYGVFGAVPLRLRTVLSQLVEPQFRTKEHRIAGHPVVRVAGAQAASGSGKKSAPAESQVLERIDRRLSRIESLLRNGRRGALRRTGRALTRVVASSRRPAGDGSFDATGE